MAWVELRFETSAVHQEEHEGVLWALGAQAVSFLENGLDEIWEPTPGEQVTWRNATIVGLFDAADDFDHITKHLAKVLPASTAIEMNPLEDKEWTREWMSQFKPIQFGKRLWVCPSWEQPPQTENAVIIQLDPGIAFGTGTHPTTAMCLTVMDSLDFKEKTVIDYGCGSGILAIGAVLLGAKQVWAIDHCQQALESTTANAERNQIAPHLIEARLPDAVCETLQAEVALANILAGPLIELSGKLLAHLKPGGQLVLSGLLAEQVDQVLPAYLSKGAKLLAQHEQEEWVCLHFEKVFS